MGERAFRGEVLPEAAPSPLSFVRQARDYAVTLFLFTREDLKHLFLPVAIFAALSVPDISPNRIPPALAWTWLHLLQFCTSNQTMDIAEDAANKPFRPIPSGRISLRHARALRWILMPTCVALSFALGAGVHGASLALAFIAHNEMRMGERHWVWRGLTNAWGYASFNAGAASILSSRGQGVFDTRMALSFALNSLLILTTTHAQDFRDVLGDARLSPPRPTLPLTHPSLSRVAIPLLIVAWSIGLSVLSAMDPLIGAAFVVCAAAVAGRFYAWRDVETDKKSYLYYNLWLAAAQVVHTPVMSKVWSARW